MGLTKITVDRIGNSFDIKWKEIIRCEDMSNDILMVKKKIENGCIVNINKNQCVAICKDGKIVDATTEEGTYIYDDSQKHIFNSLIFGKDFENIWNKNQYNIDEDCVIFFNLKKIIDNKFILENPIEYTDKNNKLFSIKSCDIKYSIIITNPAMFFNETPKDLEVYRKGRFNKNIKIYVEQSIIRLFKILENKVESVNEIENHPEIVQKAVKNSEINEPLIKKGINIISLNIENIKFSRKYRKKNDNDKKQNVELDKQKLENETKKVKNDSIQSEPKVKEPEIIEELKELENNIKTKKIEKINKLENTEKKEELEKNKKTKHIEKDKKIEKPEIIKEIQELENNKNTKENQKSKITRENENKEDNKKTIENNNIKKEKKSNNIVDQLEKLFADE